MTPIELITKPGALRAALSRLRALSRLQLSITAPGQAVVCQLRTAEANAVLTGTLELEVDTLDPETIVWRDRAIAAGGTFGARSIAWADALIVAVKAASFNAKIKYLLPLLGGNLATARVPLRDSLAVGIATNNGFVNADFSESTGLQGNNADTLDTLVDVHAIGTSDNGGMGYWERNVPAGVQSECIGARVPATRLWQIVLDSVTPRELAYWGNVPGSFNTSTMPSNSHYYLQRASATDRILYRNGVNVASSVVNDATMTGAATFFVMGVDTSFPGEGRCGVAYLTDGTLTAAEIAALHTLLQTYLIGPTGR